MSGSVTGSGSLNAGYSMLWQRLRFQLDKKILLIAIDNASYPIGYPKYYVQNNFPEIVNIPHMVIEGVGIDFISTNIMEIWHNSLRENYQELIQLPKRFIVISANTIV
jgi:hypothetical protein